MSLSPDDLGYDLIPPDPALISPDLALDAALAPMIDQPLDQPRPFGRSWQFDFLTGQFARAGGAPATTSELDTLAVWIEKTLRTARYTYSIYSDVYGVDNPDALIGDQLSDADTAVFQEAVQTALTRHDRIEDVTDFGFTFDPFDEVLYTSFTVVLDAPSESGPQIIRFDEVQL